ncbi:MAG: sugar porter family MFS transporter [Pirellulaceae bacterium]|nr:sugar porter family MFS transporter [Pirellulaceae bacterium]
MTASPVEKRLTIAPESGHLGYIWTISLVAAMGGFLFGYDWVVIGGAKPFFEKYFQLNSESLSGWANSCALLGCLLGSLVSGGLSDKFGRKKLLVVAAVLFAASSVLTGWAPTFSLFVVWRILGGVAIGMASNLSPIYIAEVSPAHLRGRLVAINQLTICFGVLAAQIANWLIAERFSDEATAEIIRHSWTGQYGWRWMFTAVTAPSLLFFFGAVFLPESPRWLVKNGMAKRAGGVLTRIGGTAYAQAEVQNIQQTISAEEMQRVRFRDLFEPLIFKILLIGIFLAVLQQWSGINVIYNYAEELYREAGYGVNDILFNIVITGAIGVVMNCIAIGTVDHFGRRILMLIGCSGIGISYLLLGAAYLLEIQGFWVLVITLTAIAFYGMSLAPVVWVLISEIFPNRIRGAAVSVAVSSLWISCFILTYTFPILKTTLGLSGTFWLYGAFCFLGFVVVLMRVPETKGKSLEQIERELTG